MKDIKYLVNAFISKSQKESRYRKQIYQERGDMWASIGDFQISLE